ncbi:hypothetical protein [Paractinoplanes atraurantiacus]|uniref:Uncharacterized protein n=1 Tax=Paractinoplanes atraurantiacus TaxID=1036182 RepID=A0A285JWZ9_9ACTN|nr:hypothetical protein [Actinoplanes atraurantiacus]SNY64808.1 hypothetical protein SAMN05421748_12755 [Actinoplanes atraurantiacus]
MTTRAASALIAVLLDGNAREDERDDAAMGLSAFDEPAVHAALAQVATDAAESELVAAGAGESLAELWIVRGVVDRTVFERLVPAARAEVVGLVGHRAPMLLPEE